MIAKCGQVLHAFMIRRLKRDVLATLPTKTEALLYVPMSRTQVELARQLLLSGSDVLGRMAAATAEGREDEGAADKDWTQVQSLLLSLRKVCSHPLLFGSWMGDISAQLDEDAYTSSGKLATLGLLLDELLPNGHRVVLFSGWTTMLDIIEDFLKKKGLCFARLDGSTNRVQRQIDIKKFNQVGSPLQVFLCSTRAGGLGITLTSADTVVLYDSDFNPQVDLQAMDRVHRIGQERKVRVLRLVTHESVEERIVQRGRDKLFLMQRTMAAGDASADADAAAPAAKVSRSEAIQLLEFGVAGALSAQQSGADPTVTAPQVAAVLSEIQDAMEASEPSITVGIGGRTPSAKASAAALAAASSKLTRKKEVVPVAPEAVARQVEQLGRGSRERSSRFVKVGEDLVLKINNYSLEDGEASVFDSELKGRQERPGERDTSRMRAGVDYDNQPLCQVCWTGGELICCDYCPGAVHPECIGIDDVNSLPFSWACPHHKCNLCGRKAHAAGGLLFRCEACPKAWCEDHLPLDAELLGGEVERLKKLGFPAVKQACYCYCGPGCRELRQQRDEEDELEEQQQKAEAEAEEGEEDDDDDDDDGEEDDEEDDEEDGEEEEGEEGEEGDVEEDVEGEE